MSSVPLPQSFRILAESRNYVLGNVYEYGSIIHKSTGEESYIGDCYGDPEFGLIDKEENWAMLFGSDTYLWTPGRVIHLNKAKPDFAELFKWPLDARQSGNDEVEILDTFTKEKLAIYSFNVATLEVKRARLVDLTAVHYDIYDRKNLRW